MRKHIRIAMVLLILSGIAVVKGFSDDSDGLLIPPDERLGNGRISRRSLDNCTIPPSGGVDRCAKIDSAIAIAEAHEDSYCAGLGADLRERFNSTTHGFRPGNDEDPDAAGYIWMDDSGGPWGWHSVDPNIYVNAGNITEHNSWTPGFLSVALMHEEFHQRGWPGSHALGEPLGPPPPPCNLTPQWVS